MPGAESLEEGLLKSVSMIHYYNNEYWLAFADQKEQLPLVPKSKR